jgi:hypothetical protein
MTNLKTPPPVIYLLDYGSPECTWCEDPSPSGEDHSPVRYVREDWKAIAEQLAERVQWFLDNDETMSDDEPLENHGGQTWDQINAYWLDGNQKAQDALTLFQQAKDAAE